MKSSIDADGRRWVKCPCFPVPESRTEKSAFSPYSSRTARSGQDGAGSRSGRGGIERHAAHDQRSANATRRCRERASTVSEEIVADATRRDRSGAPADCRRRRVVLASGSFVWIDDGGCNAD